MSSEVYDSTPVYEDTFPEDTTPDNRSSVHQKPPKNLELFAVKTADLRTCILSMSAYLLREMSGEDYCSIPIEEDDPSAIRLRLLAVKVADALDTMIL